MGRFARDVKYEKSYNKRLSASAALWLCHQLMRSLRETDFTEPKHERIILYRLFFSFFISGNHPENLQFP